jgi:hypothetical protein
VLITAVLLLLSLPVLAGKPYKQCASFKLGYMLKNAKLTSFSPSKRLGNANQQERTHP